MAVEREYVLGTHDEEIGRLGLQHLVWRPQMLAGGEPDIARTLPSLLGKLGFVVRDVRPILFTVRPSDFLWQWPSTFLRSCVRRLADIGRVDVEFADTVIHEFEQAERDPCTFMMTPLVLEIIAERAPHEQAPINER